MRVFSKLWATYQKYLLTNPWKTQTLTTAVMFTSSDILAQQFVEKKGSRHSFRRTIRMSVMGVIVGPIQRTWFLTLERFIPPTSKIQIVKKLIVDQAFYGPFIVFFFYSLSTTLSGKDLNDLKLLLQERYLSTMFTAYKVWPFVQAVNFTFIPLHHRANFVQAVALCWNMYLSWMANKPVTSTTTVYETSGEMVPSLSSDLKKQDHISTSLK